MTKDTDKQSSFPLPDPAKLNRHGGFPGTAATTMAAVLHAGADLISAASRNIAENQMAADATAAPMLAKKTTPLAVGVKPLGYGWTKDAKSGEYWFDKAASLVVPFRLPKGTRLVIKGGARARWTAPQSLTVMIGQQVIGGNCRWLTPGAWQYDATVNIEPLEGLPATLITLLCKSRAATQASAEDGRPIAISSLRLNQVDLVPPSALR